MCNVHHNVFTSTGISVGAVRVYYSITSGHVTDLIDELEESTAGEDFIAVDHFIDFNNGQKSAHIPLTVLDDSVPEVREVFLVNLTGRISLAGLHFSSVEMCPIAV